MRIMQLRLPLVGLLLALCTSALTGCTLAPARSADNKRPISVPIGTTTKSILLTKMVTNIPLGERVLNTRYGWFAVKGYYLDWRGGRLNLTDAEILDTFRHELRQSNYSIAGDSKSLFDDASVRNADLLIAGSIEKVETNVWFPFSGSPDLDVGITDKLKGSSFMQVRWQIYSKVEKKVIYEVTTEGSYKSDEIITGEISTFLKQAFSSNVRNLLADPGFYALSTVSSPKEAAPNI